MINFKNLLKKKLRIKIEDFIYRKTSRIAWRATTSRKGKKSERKRI